MLPPLPVIPVRVYANGSAWKSLGVITGVDPRPHLAQLGVPLVDGPALSVTVGTLYTFCADGYINYRWTP